eukprot:COSAG03_NODE_22307_length_292_cov_4.538860_2_plen_43_part_01
MVCAATGVGIDSSNYVEYLTAPSMQWAASQCVHPPLSLSLSLS